MDIFSAAEQKKRDELRTAREKWYDKNTKKDEKKPGVPQLSYQQPDLTEAEIREYSKNPRLFRRVFQDWNERNRDMAKRILGDELETILQEADDVKPSWAGTGSEQVEPSGLTPTEKAMYDKPSPPKGESNQARMQREREEYEKRKEQEAVSWKESYLYPERTDQGQQAADRNAPPVDRNSSATTDLGVKYKSQEKTITHNVKPTEYSDLTKRLQQAVIDHGGSVGKDGADGYFGNDTLAGLKAMGLDIGDGGSLSESAVARIIAKMEDDAVGKKMGYKMGSSK